MPAEVVRDAVRTEIETRRTAILNLHKEIAQLKSIHNLVAPVNSLPPELLNMVFRQAGDDLINITHVCRHWRDLALHAPALWTRVVHTSPEGVKTFLQRSKGLPLDISLTVREIPTVATVRALTREIHRTRSLRVCLPRSAGLQLVTRRLMSSWPLLEELSIKQCPSPLGNHPPSPPSLGPQGPPTDFDGAPLLRSLALDNTALPYLPRGPNLLTSIELTGMISVGDTPLMLDLLERSPLLERLKIDGPFNYNALAPSVHRTVSLPCLKYLKIHGYCMRGVGAFLSSLVLPEQTNISLFMLLGCTESFADFIPAYDPENVRFQSLRGLKRLELLWGLDSLSMQAYRQNDDLFTPALKTIFRDSPDPGERFLRNWPIDAAHLETLVICGSYSRRSPDDHTIARERWAPMLASVPALKTLRLMSVNEATLDGFAQELGQERLQPLCAQLETLELFDIDPGVAFWDVLKDAAIGRSPAAGGRFSKIELFNTSVGSVMWSASDLSSISKAGVTILHDLESDTEHIAESGET